MDDQAQKLRQLVKHVRQAAAVATGPPLVFCYSAQNDQLGPTVARLVVDGAAARGIRTRQETPPLAADDEPSNVDWRVLQHSGAFVPTDLDIWQRASAVLVATYADDESIVETYTALKAASQHTPLPPLELLVARDNDTAEATAAISRLSQTCQRFLLGSIAGTTLLPSAYDIPESVVEPLLARLSMMAPVAANSNSPIAAAAD